MQQDNLDWKETMPFNSYENSKSYSVQRGKKPAKKLNEPAKRLNEPVKEAERQRQHELQMAELLNREGRRENERVNEGKSPKLLSFVDGKDDLHCYLQRFERFAKVNNWSEED